MKVFTFNYNKSDTRPWQKLINSYTRIVPIGELVHPSPLANGLQ